MRCISLQPDSGFHGLEGWKHMATAIVPKIYDPRWPTQNFEIRPKMPIEWPRRLAREEGLLVSPSAAAAMVGALRVAAKLAERRLTP